MNVLNPVGLQMIPIPLENYFTASYRDDNISSTSAQGKVVRFAHHIKIIMAEYILKNFPANIQRAQTGTY